MQKLPNIYKKKKTPVLVKYHYKIGTGAIAIELDWIMRLCMDFPKVLKLQIVFENLVFTQNCWYKGMVSIG